MKLTGTACGISLVLCVAIIAFLEAAPPESSAQDRFQSAARFPVAHEHSGSWCLGYLYIGGNVLRYEVVEPAEDQGHSFQLSQSEVQQVRRWSFLNQSLNAIEIQTTRGIYHFWLLHEEDIQRRRAYTWNPADAASADILIAVMQAQNQAAPTRTDVAAANTPSTSTASNASDTDNETQQRFPVAHAHFGTWCMGYLSITSDSIRYEVLRPERDKGHSFRLKRTEIAAVRPWVFGNRPTNAVEIRTAHQTYHFWLMQSETDLREDRKPGWRPAEAAPANVLMAALEGAPALTATGRSTAVAAAQPYPSNPRSSAANVPASPMQARLSGIYRARAKEGTDPSSSLDISDLAARTPAYSYLVFFPSGRVKRGLVISGLDSYNDEFSMRTDIASGGKTSAQWGMYRISGDRGRISFADTSGGRQLVSGLKGEVWDMVLYQDRLEINGETYFLLDSGRGKPLEGTYKPFGDMKQPGISFTPDGEFIDEGILNYGAMANLSYGAGTGVAIGYKTPNGGRGTYRVSNYTLTLNYTNSSPAALFYLNPANSNTNAGEIYINNVRYQRVR